ncbi:hypothetical protein C7974DRAFT_193364 [Boeremia exigua]|uniref:uncharacterized protein n=1 Tax=Boeremia exigua TaxID=749465 RepID=UPI001E8EE913|nr:uncharacterized protein C7974DRAFT_193364 [Boeremia exigua]KAH6629800.1 hypothetical protein C7974DRAFT_193364 [Boeremia exigua]
MSVENSSPTGSTASHRNTHHDENPDQRIEWLLAIPNGNKKRVSIHVLQTKRGETGATIMSSIKREYEAINPARRWLPSKIELEDATISLLCIGDLEAQDYPREVIVETHTPRLDLTKAFKNPLLLRGTGFASANEQFVLPAKGTICDREVHAILFKSATCKEGVVAVLVVLVLFSIMIGLAVGFWTRDAKTGLAVCAGAIGIFALIQASLAGIEAMKSKAHL